MNTQPLVSIIMPSYNSEEFIEESIQSVLLQSYKNIELIIVDDLSNDNSINIIKEIQKKDHRITLIKNTINLGASKSRNRGISISQGRFIAFLDSDDIWKQNKLEIQIHEMLNSNAALSFTSYEIFNKETKNTKLAKIKNQINYNQLLKNNIIGCSTVTYDRDKIGTVYMSTKSKREDFATWLNILKMIPFATGIETPLTTYRVHKNQSSSNKIKMAKENWHLYRKVENICLLKSIYYFSHYAINGIIKKYKS